VLAAAGAPVASLQVTQGGPDWLHPGRAGTIRLGPKAELGWFGEVHPAVLDRMDVKGPIVAFEIVLDRIPAPKSRTATRPPLEALQLLPVRRDFAFLLDEDVAADRVVRAAKGADKALISEVSVFDVFSGGALGPGKKSLAIEVVLQPRERTLTDGEIEAVAARIVAQVEKATGGTLRT
jgi:phenylalanyl-tRNA synthetase beta chain